MHDLSKVEWCLLRVETGRGSADTPAEGKTVKWESHGKFLRNNYITAIQRNSENAVLEIFPCVYLLYVFSSSKSTGDISIAMISLFVSSSSLSNTGEGKKVNVKNFD